MTVHDNMLKSFILSLPALNDFLAQQFGTQDAAFASSPPQPDASPDTAQPGEDSSSPESDTGVPDVGPGVDETDIDDSDGDAPPIPAADVDEDTKMAEPEMADTDVKTTQEEKEKEAESPYIDGVTVIEGEEDEDEEEEEAEDAVKEERTPDAEPERAEEKVSETAPSSDKVSQQEDDTETEPAEPSVKVGEEKAEPAAGSDQSSTGSTVVTQDEDRSGKATPSQSGIVEPRDHQPGGQDVVKQVIEEMSQDVPIAGLGVPADQKAEGEVKTDPQNTVQVETGAVTKPDGSVDAGAEGVSAPDAASVDTSATDSAAVPQQKEKEKLLFQSEVAGHGEDEEDEEEEEEEEKNPAVFHTDALDALEGSHLKDTSGKEAKEEASQDKLIPGQPSLADQEMAGKQPAIQPDKTLSEPAAPSATISHQPVDIDFVAGHIQDSGVTLESSQTVVEQEQVAAETPTLEGTMTSMQHAAQGVSNTAVPAETEDTQPAQSGAGDQVPTTVIDGTRFYLENGEIADIVPESSAAQETTVQSPTPKEPDMSLPPAQATQAESIQPTGVTVLSEVSLQEAVLTTPPPLNSNIPDPTPQTPEKVQNATEGAAAAGSHAHQPDAPKVADPVQQGGSREQYQTSADFLSRKVLSVNSQVPAGQVPKQGNGDQEVPAQEQGIEWTSDQQGNTQASGEVSGEPPAASDSATKAEDSATTAAEAPASDVSAKAETPASEIEPSASVAVGTASVTVEGEELADKFVGGEDQQTGEEGQLNAAGEDAAATTSEPVDPQGGASSLLPPVAENKVSDAENAQGEKVVQEEAMKSVTPPPETVAWDGVPPPPAADEATPSPVEQVIK